MKFSPQNLDLSLGPLALIRGTQMLFAILVLALSAAAIDATTSYFYSFYYGVDASALFISIFTLIMVPILYLGIISPHNPPYCIIHCAIEIFLNLYWFATFIALAAIHGPTSCGGGGKDFCAIGKADAAMAAVCWATFVGSSYFVIKNYMEIYPELRSAGRGVSAVDVENHPNNANEMKQVSVEDQAAVPPPTGPYQGGVDSNSAAHQTLDPART